MEDVGNRVVAAAVVLMLCMSGCGTPNSWKRHSAEDRLRNSDPPTGVSTFETEHTTENVRATQLSEQPSTAIPNGALLQSDTSPFAENRAVVPAGAVLHFGLTPAEKGIQRAKDDIAFGKMKILQYGMPQPHDKPPVDEQSGLPMDVSMGCMMSADRVAEIDAYNEIMRREAAARKSESGSSRDGTGESLEAGR